MTTRSMVIDGAGNTEPLLFQPFAGNAERKEEKEKKRRQEVERQITLARAEGRARGIAEGQQQAATALEQPAEAIKEAARLLAETRAQLSAKTIPELVKLCLTVAKKIAGDALRAHPEEIESLLSDILEEASDKTIASIRLHPDDIQALDGSDIIEALSKSDVHIVPDTSLSRGGSVIETDHGILDARVETRIDVLCQQLMETANRE